MCTAAGKGEQRSKQKQQEMRRVVKCGEPSPQPRARPLGDGSAAQSCRSEAPRCLGGLAQSSSSGLKEGNKKTNKHEMHFCMHTCTCKDFRVRGSRSLTGDPDGCLAALGGSQVAPGDAQAPVILGAVEIFHLLTRHVDHHFADFQPCERERR